MKIQYFSVFDDKSKLFSPCFPSQTYGTAERSLRETVRTPDTQPAKYPEDFALYHCFDFDDETGYVVESYEPPVLICRASDLVNRSE